MHTQTQTNQSKRSDAVFAIPKSLLSILMKNAPADSGTTMETRPPPSLLPTLLTQSPSPPSPIPNPVSNAGVCENSSTRRKSPSASDLSWTAAALLRCTVRRLERLVGARVMVEVLKPTLRAAMWGWFRTPIPNPTFSKYSNSLDWYSTNPHCNPD